MSRKAPNNKVDVVLGAQWGDEGKGKVVDYLAERARFVVSALPEAPIGDELGHLPVNLSWRTILNHDK